MKTVYIGKEGSGKTLFMGRDSYEVVFKNVSLYKKTGVMRPIISNIRYSDSFLIFARSKGVPVKEWQHISELEHFSECDLFIDEVGAYFDSRTYADLPLSTRLWLAQAQKLGVHIYAGAQDWAQIDVSFRRLVNRLYDVRKLLGSKRPSLSIPGSKTPWAIILAWKVMPAASSDSAELRTISIFPDLHLFLKKSMHRFDTNARIKESSPPPLKKVVRVCPEDGFTKVRYY